MIYLDNAATTLVKPKSVTRAMVHAMETCANPGRGGHRAAMQAAGVVYECRERAAAFFEISDSERVVFTQNATHALNIAIKSLLHDGGHAVISGYEHNSVVRPLTEMEPQGVTYTVANAPLFQPQETLRAMEAAIRPDTVCIICNHISNVFGFVQDLQGVNALCRKYNLMFIADLSQSAGMIPVSASKLDRAAYLCMPGHKGLYGPQGTGILICCKDNKHYSATQGGTGSESRNLHQPSALPEALESGTLNVPGIAGLSEGIRFVQKLTPEAIGLREQCLKEQLLLRLRDIPQLQCYAGGAAQSGVISLTSSKMPPEELGERLAERGFCMRAGLHCAPLAHQNGGTLSTGTLRVSFSAFNTKGDLCALAAALKTIFS